MVAATAIALLLLVAGVLVGRFFKAKLQFSLAMLLMMVPVMAIPCAWLTQATQQSRQQRDLVELCHGAETDPEDVPENWLTENLGMDFFREVIGLQLGDYPRDDSINDEHMMKLAAHTQLRSLYVVGHKVTDAGLQHLRGLTQLKELHLNGTLVTDSGLKYLTGLTQLETLGLNDTKVTDSGLRHLAGLAKLERLDLEGTQITDAGLEHLKGLTQLQTLDLREAYVTDAGLKHLEGLTQLHRLDLNNTQVTNAGVDRIEIALPDCAVQHFTQPVSSGTLLQEYPSESEDAASEVLIEPIEPSKPTETDESASHVPGLGRTRSGRFDAPARAWGKFA